MFTVKTDEFKFTGFLWSTLYVVKAYYKRWTRRTSPGKPEDKGGVPTDDSKVEIDKVVDELPTPPVGGYPPTVEEPPPMLDSSLKISLEDLEKYKKDYYRSIV